MSSKPIRLGVDLDGIVCDYHAAWNHLAWEMFGTILPLPPTTWHWDLAAGLTPEQVGQMWDHVRGNPTFWEDLSPLPGVKAALRAFNAWGYAGTVETYFITSRPGKAVKWQSERWLKNQGMSNPTVLIADGPDAKALLCDGLNVSYFIDDSPDNLEAVEEALGGVVDVYTIDWPYNVGAPGIRVPTIEHFMEAIQERLKK